MTTDREEVARSYYRTIDDGAYDELRALLTPAFVHDRPDVTLEGGDRFVRFMREERPMTDTTHAIDECYVAAKTVAVRGRLRQDGENLFGFVDVFTFDGDRIERIDTYTR